MKIACVGAGPAGLYFAISMKLRDPSHDITVFERNAPGVTFGWGVVFSDLTVENITANDPVSARTITEEFAHWDDIDVHFGGECITSSGHERRAGRSAGLRRRLDGSDRADRPRGGSQGPQELR